MADFIPRPSSAGNQRQIRFVGVFDTVAAIGAPNLSSSDKPVSDVVFENGTISPNIEEALHLLSLDEKRKAFQPTLMNRDERVTEVWFAGAHSDVGGGYRYDGLADVALEFMLEEISRRGLGIKLLAPTNIDYDTIAQENPDLDLDYDDIVIQPNPYGKSHQQDRPPISTAITLGDRLLRINENDGPSGTAFPFVHRSVIDRLLNDPDYRPESLRRCQHRVWYSHTNTPEATGLRDHLLYGRPALKALEVGEKIEVVVHANLKHNKIGILLEKGAKYRFTAPVFQGDIWYDAGIDCGPEGWDRQTEKLGFKEFFIRFKEDDRRYPEAKWFELIAGIGEDDQELWRPLRHAAAGQGYTPKSSGELIFFANDLPRFYGNNLGSISVRVARE